MSANTPQSSNQKTDLDTAFDVNQAGYPNGKASPVLSVSSLNVRFNTENGVVHAVRDVSLHCHAGETLAIVGESGSGKTALALAIMGLTSGNGSVTGTVRFRGSPLTTDDDLAMSGIRGKSIAMIFQDPLAALTPVYTVGEQIIECIQTHERCGVAEARERAIALLATVGIPEAAQRVDAYPHEFSGGMRQRILIAMAIANKPQVIIADEPTTALDVTIQAQILDLLQSVCRELGAALLIITHDLGVVSRLADNVAVMYAGKVVEQADVYTLFRTPRMPYTVGLLASMPGLALPADELLPVMSGSVPGQRLPGGCAFAPRCPVSMPACTLAEPGLEPTGTSQHLVACLRRDEVSSGVSVSADMFRSSDTSLSQASVSDGRNGEQTAQFAQQQSGASAGDRTPLVELMQVVKHYPVYKGVLFKRKVGVVHAVDGIDLAVFPGETLALVGESGCGKSTAAMSVLELQQPDEGTIRVFGRDVAQLHARRERRDIRQRIQVVFQDPVSSLDPRLPVYDLVAEPLRQFNRSHDRITQRVNELLDMVGLSGEFAARFATQLSGGQAQRVCIARALALTPEVLVLDEPVSALDVSVRAGIVNLLQALKRSLGLSYLFIAHDLALVRHFADRVVIMYLGRIVESGAVEDVFTSPAHPYTRSMLSLVPEPDPATERQRPQIIPKGDLPSPVNPPQGCRFHTRCPLLPELSPAQQSRCRREPPALSGVRKAMPISHQTACHFHQQQNSN